MFTNEKYLSIGYSPLKNMVDFSYFLILLHFYCAILRRSRLCHSKSSARLSVCLSVRPSVTFIYDFHTQAYRLEYFENNFTDTAD